MARRWRTQARPLGRPRRDPCNWQQRSSRFTQIQADEFIKDWTVVEHISNTTTGFSGTLFRALRNDESRGIKAGELVLSFRSTEFADDAARDNQATNVMEIKAEGFAFGQIADMEKWFSELKSSGKLDPGASLTVTGYSLGGHLATAFNLLHGNDLTAFGAPLIAATYTFNGAGVGTVTSGGTLAQVMADFTRHRALGSNADLFTEPTCGRATSGSRTSSRKAPTSRWPRSIKRCRRWRSRAWSRWAISILYKTLERIRSVVYEAERIMAGVPSGTAGAAALPVSVTAIAAIGLDYQLAVRRAAEKTAGYRTDVISGGIDALAGRNPAPGGAIANFYDLYGASPPSAVANSQIHYGTPSAHLHRRPAAVSRHRDRQRGHHQLEGRRGQAAGGQLRAQRLRRHPQPGADRRFAERAEHAGAAGPERQPGTLDAILAAASNKGASRPSAPRARPRATRGRRSQEPGDDLVQPTLHPAVRKHSASRLAINSIAACAQSMGARGPKRSQLRGCRHA